MATPTARRPAPRPALTVLLQVRLQLPHLACGGGGEEGTGGGGVACRVGVCVCAVSVRGGERRCVFVGAYDVRPLWVCLYPVLM